MDTSFSDELSCTAALSSASSSSHEKCFYSAPTSPSRSALNGFQTKPITPITYEDATSNPDEFEFETSRPFNHSESIIETRKSDENPLGLLQEQHQSPESGDSLPTMAFADELFCDGKVLPLSLMSPLNLPPRLLHYEKGNKFSPQSSTAPSLSFPFSSQSLWNDDFDPFMAALEKVKEEKEKHAPRKQNGIERGDFCAQKRKRDKIMKYLFGNADMDKSRAKYKSAGSVKPKALTQSTHWDKDMTNIEMNTTALVCYKPRLLLCLGFGGGRYVS